MVERPFHALAGPRPSGWACGMKGVRGRAYPASSQMMSAPGRGHAPVPQHDDAAPSDMTKRRVRVEGAAGAGGSSLRKLRRACCQAGEREPGDSGFRAPAMKRSASSNLMLSRPRRWRGAGGAGGVTQKFGPVRPGPWPRARRRRFQSSSQGERGDLLGPGDESVESVLDGAKASNAVPGSPARRIDPGEIDSCWATASLERH